MNLKVKADIGKNRLYFKISGPAVKKELDKLYTDVRFCISDLKPGFDVISDLSECSLAHLSGVPTFRKIMNYLLEHGVGQVVRVIDGKSLIFKQILNLSSRICGYRPIYASTLEEAEEKLEKSIKRNGIRFNINNLPVDYMANGASGKGSILDLSTSGCAIGSTTLPVSDGEEISLKVIFKEKDDPEDEFIFQAKVVRVEDTSFAAEFRGLDEQRKDLLWKCLLNESQRDI